MPEPADVLVTETLSSCGFDNENIVEYVLDAKRRLLKPGARVIPAAVETLFTPIQSDEFGLGRLAPALYGFDYAPFRSVRYSGPGMQQAYRQVVPSSSPSPCGAGLSTSDRTRCRRRGRSSLDFQITREGRVDGFLGWFDALLAPGVSLTNSPHRPPTNWEQLYFPAADQPRVRPGQILRLTVDPRLQGGGSHWAYQIEVRDRV